MNGWDLASLLVAAIGGASACTVSASNEWRHARVEKKSGHRRAAISFTMLWLTIALAGMRAVSLYLGWPR